ncbi:hypothetical protein, partial [Pseudomonas amygdali]|uniref:hypothetical protein n=1 Tax=Pseudomonas amygdali TaxID=47877 RepID=UPI00195850CB
PERRSHAGACGTIISNYRATLRVVTLSRDALRHNWAAAQRHALPAITAHKPKRFFITMALATQSATLVTGRLISQDDRVTQSVTKGITTRSVGTRI